ncbi:MAG: phosphoglycerate dehydrogenase [Gemmataceae bacterium]|nr:phosphoglycerate dehydrogenase [Gemmataceae bacterium]
MSAVRGRVLVGPALLRQIEDVFGPILQQAGLQVVYPPRRQFLEEVQMTEEELLEQLPGCVAALAGSEPYTRRVLERAAAAGLLVVARAGVGYDGVDVATATELGIAVCYAPGTNHEAVAEHTFALMLALLRNLRGQDAAIRRGEWPRRVVEPLRDQVLGIVGLGRIGKAVAMRARAFALDVWAYDIAPDTDFAHTYGVRLVPSLEILLRQADIVTLHVPKTPQTIDLINRHTLGWMKPTAILINTARGGIVNEKDLYDALQAGRLAGAGLDVFAAEPPVGSPLLQLDNVIMTAHTAGIDRRSRQEMARVSALAIAQLLAGDWPTQWLVNPAVQPMFRRRWQQWHQLDRSQP